MASCITLASQKGGVGKTTSAVNLAASLALAGRRVLLVDLDPQGNASSGVGFPRTEDEQNGGGLLSAVLEGRSLDGLVRETAFDGLSVVCTSAELSRLALVDEVQGPGLELFRRRVRDLGGEFDFLLFDCPPSLGGLPTIALGASDRVLVPIQCEYYAMEGLSQILPIISTLQQSSNPKLEIGGLLLTMFCEELDLSHDVAGEVRGYFGDGVFQAVIPRDVVLAEAASHGLPAYYYAPLSRGAWSYLELAREVLEHEWT